MCGKERGNVLKVKFRGGKKRVSTQKKQERKRNPPLGLKRELQKKPHERRVVHFAGMGCLKPLGRIETGVSVTQWGRKEKSISRWEISLAATVCPPDRRTAPIKNVSCLGKVCTVFFGGAPWGNGVGSGSLALGI